MKILVMTKQAGIEVRGCGNKHTHYTGSLM